MRSSSLHKSVRLSACCRHFDNSSSWYRTSVLKQVGDHTNVRKVRRVLTCADVLTISADGVVYVCIARCGTLGVAALRVCGSLSLRAPSQAASHYAPPPAAPVGRYRRQPRFVDDSVAAGPARRAGGCSDGRPVSRFSRPGRPAAVGRRRRRRGGAGRGAGGACRGGAAAVATREGGHATARQPRMPSPAGAPQPAGRTRRGALHRVAADAPLLWRVTVVHPLSGGAPAAVFRSRPHHRPFALHSACGS